MYPSADEVPDVYFGVGWDGQLIDIVKYIDNMSMFIEPIDQYKHSYAGVIISVN